MTWEQASSAKSSFAPGGIRQSHCSTSRDSIGRPETQTLWAKVSVKPAWGPGP